MRKAEFLPSENVEVIEFDTETTHQTATDADNKADDLISALNDDREAFVNVMRQPFGGNSRMEFVERIPADKYDYGQLLSYLATTYGGGEYRVMIYAKGKLRANKLQTIASKIKSDVKAPSPTSDASNMLAAVLRQIEANNVRMMEMMQSMKPTQSRTEWLAEMLQMKQLFGGERQSGGLGELRDALGMLQELGIPVGVGNVIEGEKEDASFTDLLAKFTPVIEHALSPQSQAQPQVDPLAARKKQMNMMQQMMIKAKIEPFVKAAIKNSSPEIYAEMLIDQLDEKYLPLVTAPDAIEKLEKIDYRVKAHKPWFLLLAEHVKAQLGQPSTVAHLYESDEDDITPEDDNEESDPDNASNLST